MTEEQRARVVENPGQFLKSCRYHEQRIKESLELIRHYKEVAESITAEIKEVTTFSLTPSCKVENCVIEIVSIQEDIQKEVQELRSDFVAAKEVIGLVDDDLQRTVLEARYLRRLKWEEIAVLISCSLRWTRRIHDKALENISEKMKKPF